MANATVSVRLLDIPEVKKLLELVEEAAMTTTDPHTRKLLVDGVCEIAKMGSET